jgi:hypothetical protein
VQQMHSDGSGEFINKDLDKFLKNKGVKQTVSALHISEHNRVVKRMFRSIISIAWCLLIHSTILVQGSMVCMPCTQLYTYKNGGWCDTRMLKWCKARRECLLHFQV